MENEKFNEQDVRTYYKFLDHSNPTEVIVFDPVKYPTGKVSWVTSEEEFVALVRKYNIQESIDVYAGYRDRIDNNNEGVTHSTGIFQEIDEHDIDKPEELPKLKKFYADNNIKLQLIGFSGGGFHIYTPHDKLDLTLTDPDPNFKENYHKSLLNMREILQKNNIDVDTAVFDLQRVTRILGTFNWKRGKLSKIVELNEINDIERLQNHKSLMDLRKKYNVLTESVEVGSVGSLNDSIEILNKYQFEKKEPWLYDLITKDIVIKKDTGGNSIFYKNSAIALVREGLNQEEIRVVAKAICSKVKDRPLAAFYGWIEGTQNGKYAQVNRIEINNAIQKSGYDLRVYTYVNETDQKIKEAEPLEILSILDCKNYKPNKKYLIKGRKYPGENEMLFAPTMHFKSITALYEACCIAAGRNYLGKYKTRKSPVLFILAETNKDWLHDKLPKIMRGLGIRSNRIPLSFLTRDKCGDLLDPEFMAKLCKTIEEKNIKLLYVDTINVVTPSIDENSARDVTRLFNEFLKPVTDKYGCNLTYLHHTDKKGSDFLGSTKWKGNSDQVSRIDRKELNNRITIHNEKNRRGEAKTLEVEIIFSDNKIEFKLLAETEPSLFNKKKKMSQQEFFILKLNALCNKEMERKEIMEVFAEKEIKYKPATLDRALKEWRGEKDE